MGHLPPLVREYVYKGMTPRITLIMLAARPKLDHKLKILFTSYKRQKIPRWLS